MTWFFLVQHRSNDLKVDNTYYVGWARFVLIILCFFYYTCISICLRYENSIHLSQGNSSNGLLSFIRLHSFFIPKYIPQTWQCQCFSTYAYSRERKSSSITDIHPFNNHDTTPSNLDSTHQSWTAFLDIVIERLKKTTMQIQTKRWIEK